MSYSVATLVDIADGTDCCSWACIQCGVMYYVWPYSMQYCKYYYTHHRLSPNPGVKCNKPHQSWHRQQPLSCLATSYSTVHILQNFNFYSLGWRTITVSDVASMIKMYFYYDERMRDRVLLNWFKSLHGIPYLLIC